MNIPKSSIRIYLLGRFEVDREGQKLRADEWTRRRAAALLKYLAVQKRLVKDQAIDLFWPEGDLDSGANNLYRTIHDLRQTLNKAFGPGTDQLVFSFEDGVLSLDEGVRVDVLDFERLCSTLTPAPSERIAALEQALALYHGNLLPDDLYTEWTLVPREALHRLYREASLSLAILYRETHEYNRIFPLLTSLLAHDKADEPVHRELMRAYALAGRRHDALRQFQACAEAIASELDLAPEPETAALYTQILNGQLTSPPGPSTTTKIHSSPFSAQLQPSPFLVGREAEFESLRLWQAATQLGQGRTLLIAGDTGVGKTLLAGEVVCAANGAGITTLIGAAHEQEGYLPYQPFIEAFDRFLAEQGRPSGENPITHFNDNTGDMQRNQRALFNAAATFITDLAAKSPVLFFVDDLHAADEASLHLFHYLARQTRAAAVTLLATYRTDIANPGTSPFGSLLHGLYREHLSETLNLSPLTEAASARIMNHLLGGEADLLLVKAIHEVAEGNPFFIQEMTRSLIKSAKLEEREGRWSLGNDAELRAPNDLEGLLRERVTRLGTQVETILISAAVTGREFDFELLRSMTAQPDGALLDGLDAALAAHLLEETPSGYRFRHALIRTALYDSLSRARRARLHGRAGESIEAVYALRPRGLEAHIEELAYHFNASDRRDRSLDYLLQAGQKAASLYALEVAVGHFEQALALMDALALSDPARRWMLLESLGWWHTILADTPRAVECFEQAIALPAGDGWASAPHDRVRLHCGAAKGLITVSDLAAAEAHLQTALAEVNEQTAAPEIADLFYGIAQLHWHKGEYQTAFEAAQKSLNVAEQLNKPDAIARAFEMLALACHSLGEWQQGLVFEEKRAVLAGSGLDVGDAFDVHL